MTTTEISTIDREMFETMISPETARRLARRALHGAYEDARESVAIGATDNDGEQIEDVDRYVEVYWRNYVFGTVLHTLDEPGVGLYEEDNYEAGDKIQEFLDTFDEVRRPYADMLFAMIRVTAPTVARDEFDIDLEVDDPEDLTWASPLDNQY